MSKVYVKCIIFKMKPKNKAQPFLNRKLSMSDLKLSMHVTLLEMTKQISLSKRLLLFPLNL